MLLKNSPWAAGVHSLSAVRPWGQGRSERGREEWRERKTERERKDGYESERTVEKWGGTLMKWKQEK